MAPRSPWHALSHPAVACPSPSEPESNRLAHPGPWHARRLTWAHRLTHRTIVQVREHTAQHLDTCRLAHPRLPPRRTRAPACPSPNSLSPTTGPKRMVRIGFETCPSATARPCASKPSPNLRFHVACITKCTVYTTAAPAAHPSPTAHPRDAAWTH